MYGADFDSFVSASIPYSRWLAVKRVIKLCNNDMAPKRGEADVSRLCNATEVTGFMKPVSIQASVPPLEPEES